MGILWARTDKKNSGISEGAYKYALSGSGEHVKRCVCGAMITAIIYSCSRRLRIRDYGRLREYLDELIRICARWIP